jgi:hypothetical protein
VVESIMRGGDRGLTARNLLLAGGGREHHARRR